jgi:hypothetical protein
MGKTCVEHIFESGTSLSLPLNNTGLIKDLKKKESKTGYYSALKNTV